MKQEQIIIKAGDYMRVRGTMKEVPEIEVNIDTVYIRKNIVRIEEEDFVGWEYDEEQYSKDEFIELISKENGQLREYQTIQDSVIEEILFNIIPTIRGIGGE